MAILCSLSSKSILSEESEKKKKDITYNCALFYVVVKLEF